MRLRHIEIFHAIYRCGSITGAAKMLNVSQPSVSKVLAHAEQQLGFKLFERGKGKVVPTHEAERLISYAASAYQNINELRRVSENLRTLDSGRIRIAMTPAFGIDLVPAAIANYIARHEDIAYQVETLHYQQILRVLQESRVDIGLVFAPSAVPGIVIQTLATARFVVAMHADRCVGSPSRIRLNELAGLPFIRLSGRGPLGPILAAYLDANDFGGRTVATAETYQMAKALVSHGAGFAIIDEITARSSGHDDVVIRPLTPQLKYDIAVIHAENEPLSIVAQRFIEHLKAQLEQFLTGPLNQGP